MSKERPMIIALDVGSSHVRVVAAQETLGKGIEVLSTAETPSLGVQRGCIVNVDDASFAIKAALEEARVIPWLKQSLLFASLGGKHINSTNHYGEVKVSREDLMVSGEDVERAQEASRAVQVDKDTKIVHAIPRSYRVGGYLCRRNPLGMHGPTVGADSHIITADALSFDNLHRAAFMAGKALDGVFIAGLASGHAALTPEERDAGTVVIDIGGGTTEVVAYSGGTPFKTLVLPVGGNQIAGDLAIALNTPVHVAERLYLEEGSATMTGINPTEQLSIRCFGPTGIRHLRRGFLNEVIRLRLEEIFRMSFVPVMEHAPKPFAGNVVLVGAVARLRGIAELASAVLEAPVRVGRPVEEPGQHAALSGPAFATAVGIIRLSADAAFGRLDAAPERRAFWFLPQWLRAREAPVESAERGQAVSVSRG